MNNLIHGKLVDSFPDPGSRPQLSESPQPAEMYAYKNWLVMRRKHEVAKAMDEIDGRTWEDKPSAECRIVVALGAAFLDGVGISTRLFGGLL